MANFAMTRGDTFKLDATVTQPTGAVFDLTGSTMKFEARLTPADTVATISKTSPSGGIVFTTPLSGLARVTINPADTNTLVNVDTTLNYDLQVTTGSGEIFTVAKGLLIVRAENAQ